MLLCLAKYSMADRHADGRAVSGRSQVSVSMRRLSFADVVQVNPDEVKDRRDVVVNGYFFMLLARKRKGKRRERK